MPFVFFVLEMFMPPLFSYGTLQQEQVQLATFGRKLDGKKAAVPGYEPAVVKIPDPALVTKFGQSHHDNITATGNPSSSVQGTVFEVTEAELAMADTFEAQFNYQRVNITLASGTDAWVYVHGD